MFRLNFFWQREWIGTVGRGGAGKSTNERKLDVCTHLDFDILRAHDVYAIRNGWKKSGVVVKSDYFRSKSPETLISVCFEMFSVTRTCMLRSP